MLHNLYTPLSGALASEKVLDILANNLANTQTVGFKGEGITFKLLTPEPERQYKEPGPPAHFKVDFEEVLPLRGNEMAYVGVSGLSTDMTQGSPIETRNPLDLMIEGDGFFVVHTLEGERLTRAGTLTLSREGALVDKSGNPVLGTKGNIFLHGHKVEINPRGEIYQDGELVDRLRLVHVKDTSHLEKIGHNHFHYSGPEDGIVDQASPTLRQGFLESSNVNAIKNLTQLILAHRSFEAYQKAIQNYDSMLESSSSSLGEVRG